MKVFARDAGDCIQIRKTERGEMAVKLCTMLEQCDCGRYPCCSHE